MRQIICCKKKYTNPAAVIVGSVIERKVRTLCLANDIPVKNFDSKKGKDVFIPADKLNAELVKKNVYNENTKKKVTAHLGVRNSAAHGFYDDYNHSDVVAMLQFARSFDNEN